MKNSNFKKWAILVAFITISSAALAAPISAISVVNNKIEASNEENIETTFWSDSRDFKIVLHRIKEEDQIDPGSSADWRIRMYINGEVKKYECDGDDVTVDKTFTWENIVHESASTVDVKLELLERDLTKHDMADISAHEGGGKDDCTDFDDHRGAVFKRTFNVDTTSWMPQNEDNDYVMVDDDSNVKWYKTSGNFDGSTKEDENDATVWFNVFCENRAPYPPETPTGPYDGDINRIYTFKTRCEDPDGDRIRFGWDWDGDEQVDEVTDYYDTWQTCTITHSWNAGGIYYVRVMAIDEHDMPSELSDCLIVEIAAPNGKSGFKEEKTWFGYTYTWYLNHQETRDLVKTLRAGQNVVAAVAALIAAVALLSGIPISTVAAKAIAVAVIRLGFESIALMDMHNKGIYFRVHVVLIGGMSIFSIAYMWAQD